MTYNTTHTSNRNLSHSCTGNPNLPATTILGSNPTMIKAQDVLTLTGVGTLSVCASSKSLYYSWTVTDSKGRTVTNKTASPTPSIFTATAYTLTAGMLYSVTLKVTSGKPTELHRSSSYASVGVFVTHGVIVAGVRGAYTRQVIRGIRSMIIEHLTTHRST